MILDHQIPNQSELPVATAAPLKMLQLMETMIAPMQVNDDLSCNDNSILSEDEAEEPAAKKRRTDKGKKQLSQKSTSKSAKSSTKKHVLELIERMEQRRLHQEKESLIF